MNARPYNLDHFQRLQNRQAPVEPGSVLKSASVYECGRFTCTIQQHLGQMPPKHVAGLPTQAVNDKGRYRQHHEMASA
jgi:hypothetical protein